MIPYSDGDVGYWIVLRSNRIDFVVNVGKGQSRTPRTISNNPIPNLSFFESDLEFLNRNSIGPRILIHESCSFIWISAADVVRPSTDLERDSLL